MEEAKSTKSLVNIILIVMGVTALAIVFVSAPAERLLGDSAYRLHSAFHGVFAGIFMITMTIGLFQGLRLWSGAEVPLMDLQVGSLLNAFICLITIVFGNWIYIPYRASTGPRTYFLENSPEIHKIFFEFKEFTALFTLPLVVAAAYLISRYGETLYRHKPLRELTALLLILAFFYFMVAFGLGAAITKLKAV